MLNSAHLQPLAAELGESEKDPSVANALLAENRVARFFQARGYRYVFFPLVLVVLDADESHRRLRGARVARVLARPGAGPHRVACARLVPASLLDYIHRDAPWDGDFVRRTLEGVSRLPSIAHRSSRSFTC